MDVRAGAIRAIAATGVVAERGELTTIADEVTAARPEHYTVTLLDEPDVPQHIKSPNGDLHRSAEDDDRQPDRSTSRHRRRLQPSRRSQRSLTRSTQSAP